MPRAHLSARLFLSRPIPAHQRSDGRDGHERKRNSGHSPRVTCQSHHGHQGTQKKEPELHQVNHAVLTSLHPEQVEVEICRADELEVRRGLHSELDELWRGAALGRAAMSSEDDHDRDGYHVLTQPKLKE
jgi:hypothetical protein